MCVSCQFRWKLQKSMQLAINNGEQTKWSDMGDIEFWLLTLILTLTFDLWPWELKLMVVCRSVIPSDTDLLLLLLLLLLLFFFDPGTSFSRCETLSKVCELSGWPLWGLGNECVGQADRVKTLDCCWDALIIIIIIIKAYPANRQASTQTLSKGENNRLQRTRWQWK